MHTGRRTATPALIGALLALAIAAAPASATSIQNASGAPYTGAFNGDNAGSVRFSSPLGDITCSTSRFLGQIDSAGGPATGHLTAIDWTNGAMQACTSGIAGVNHSNFSAQGLNWTGSVNWLSDNTSMMPNMPNATLTLSGVSIFVETDLANCTFRADFMNSGGGSNQLQADLFNPDNTASGNTEVRLVSEPLESVTGGLCDLVTPATLTVTYTVESDSGSGPLQVRENPPTPPTCNPLNLSTAFQTALPVTLDCTGTGTLTYSQRPPNPANGTISNFNATAGTLTYTPNAGFSGTDTFGYRASNAAGPGADALVTVNVGAPAPDPGAPMGNPPSSAPSTGGTAGQTGGKAKKCKKAKKGAVAAKKRCKRKK